MPFTKLPLDAATAAQGEVIKLSLRSDAMGRLSAKTESKKEFMFKDMIRNSDVLMFFAFCVKVI